MKLNLNGNQRLAIMLLLNDKNKGKTSDSNFMHGVGLYDKVYIPDEVQDKIAMKTPNGPMLTTSALASLDPLPVELDYNEASKLEAILREADLAPRDLHVWYSDLKRQMDAAKTPELEPKDVRDRRLADVKAAGRK